MNNGKLIWNKRRLVHHLWDTHVETGFTEIHIPVFLPTENCYDVGNRIIDAVISLLKKNHGEDVYDSTYKADTVLAVAYALGRLKERIHCTMECNDELPKPYDSIAIIQIHFMSQPFYQYILNRYFTEGNASS